MHHDSHGRKVGCHPFDVLYPLNGGPGWKIEMHSGLFGPVTRRIQPTTHCTCLPRYLGRYSSTNPTYSGLLSSVCPGEMLYNLKLHFALYAHQRLDARPRNQHNPGRQAGQAVPVLGTLQLT